MSGDLQNNQNLTLKEAFPFYAVVCKLFREWAMVLFKGIGLQRISLNSEESGRRD